MGGTNLPWAAQKYKAYLLLALIWGWAGRSSGQDEQVGWLIRALGSP